MRRTSSRVSTTGSLCSRGARTKLSVGHVRLTVFSKKNLIAHRAIVEAEREYFLTFLQIEKVLTQLLVVELSGEHP